LPMSFQPSSHVNSTKGPDRWVLQWVHQVVAAAGVVAAQTAKH
jgi:hypothetical protein